MSRPTPSVERVTATRGRELCGAELNGGTAPVDVVHGDQEIARGLENLRDRNLVGVFRIV